ncbi:hypothetical protein CY34DRAFT_109362 [Suillus luteus UH-Slu-Lm8-n1]|uniref:Uncharacterized protein n=1 Tax=Suillus luteus UH-Slu-Lm8-n1 TaxID=930992 RepID=A0A0D0AYC6_9AGAM|nr:hypothetical protein CY34DRAFT_109362 [Suillus luteus UH-Slu-Lm8-n1]
MAMPKSLENHTIRTQGNKNTNRSGPSHLPVNFAHQPQYPPTSWSSPDYEDQDRPSRRFTRELDSAPTLGMTTCRSSSLVSRTSTKRKRAKSPFSDTSDSSDSIIEPITPPPIIHDLSRYVKRVKANPKPYRRGLTKFDSPLFDNHLCLDDSESIHPEKVLEQKKDEIATHLRNISPEAVSQAIVTMHADVEWRRTIAVARAWEIHARREHLKFLLMTLEVDGETYANAASEPLDTSMKELLAYSKDDIKGTIDDGVAAFSRDVLSFTVADSQLDYLESTSDVLDAESATTSLEDFGGH